MAVFIRADALGLSGTERPDQINSQPQVLARLQAIRAHAAVALGLAQSPEQADKLRPATPKIHWLAPAQGYTTGSGAGIAKTEADLCARALSMGRAHHAYPGTSAIATAVAAAIPGSIAAEMHNAQPGSGLRIGHAAGTLELKANVRLAQGRWLADAVEITRSARRLMRGEVFVGNLS